MAVDNHHIALFHQDTDERTHYLVNYFRAGLNQHELCIYVSASPEQLVVESFLAEGFDIRPFIEAGDLRIFDALSTYLPNSRFVADYMLANVEVFLDDATNAGYNGLRTAGEMDWISNHKHSEDEAAYYEQAVNKIGGQISFTGLCTYATDDLPTTTLEQALESHPEITRHRTSFANPYFVGATA